MMSANVQTRDIYAPHTCDLNVLVLAGYPLGTVPGQRFRFEQQIDRLDRRGIHLDVSSYLPSSIISTLHRPQSYATKAHAALTGMVRRLRDLVSVRQYDLALVYREAAPMGYPIVEQLLPSLGLPYVLDFDDAIYIPNVSRANRFLAPLKFARKTSIIARHASLVVVGNEDLATWAQTHNDNVAVIPTTIDTATYRQRPTNSTNNGPVCIGWSGSLTTVGYLDALAPILRDLQREHDVRLRVIGDEDYQITGAEVEALPWRELTEIDDLGQIDIGIMPLPDDQWARGKCGLKALQYMALGIPTVMSPVGVNTRIAEGDAARLATSPDEWHSVLTGLINDPKLREELGKRGRKRVERDYSADVITPQWAEALRSVAKSKEGASDGR